ncbi:unnamed protein product [Pocillopora meandrina]|uniref:GIY-YIG domain-containing protein n=1 Tax=Pocillopora meandrina TaxID=46732 RepID=A0AAU9X4L7_9CNID|nr:unnamed protein product [Pocillopora meandrina]
MEELPRELQESVYDISNASKSKVSTNYSKEGEASKAAVEVALPSPRELTLNVEDALSRITNKSGKYESILQQVAVEFVENLSILPLAICSDYLGKYPSFPGVYLIYYIGETYLYEDLVRPSQDKPIYVGKSKNDILNRLSDHRRNMARANDLEVTDFVVRIMTVDSKYYAPSIEAVLKDHYDPLWNNKTVKFSFGNAKDSKSNWYKYHVAEVKFKREEIIKRVEDFSIISKAEPALNLTTIPL